MEFVITKNERLKGIEVDFLDGKPEPEVTRRLKTSGLRWNPKKKVWYCRLSHGFTALQVKSIVLGDDSHSINQLLLKAFQNSLSAYKEEHRKLRGIKPRHVVRSGNKVVGRLVDLCGFSWVKFWASSDKPQNKRLLKHLKTISDTEDSNSWIYTFDETISLRISRGSKGGFELRLHFTNSNLNPQYLTPQKMAHQAFCSVMNQKAYDLYEDSELD